MPTAGNTDRSVRLLRRFAAAALTSLMFLCIVWVVHRFGMLDEEQFHIACAATLACMAVFYLLIHRGWNERRRDPSLSVPMIVASTSVNTYVLYSMHSGRGAFVLIYLVSMLFGVFHLSTRQMLRVAALILVLYGVVIWRLAAQGLAGAELRIELLQWTALAFVALWFSIMVGYINTLMTRLDQSEVDELTGAYTRRRVIEILRHEKFRADRGAGPLCVCLLETDHLKRVNDTNGHLAGDWQLKMVVSAVQNELRNIDYIGRYGGDEFLVVLTQTPLAGARECAERFCRALGRISAGEKNFVTISIGIAEYRPGESMTQAIQRADVALYRAKERGRNRIECESAETLSQFTAQNEARSQ